MYKKYLHEGILEHNLQGRYCFKDGYYFTSGDSLEIYYDEMWLLGRIEYSHEYKDYYFCNDKEGIYIYDINGLKARV